MQKERLAELEERVLGIFRDAGTVRILTKAIFDSAGEYANADLVRAFEDMEKRGRLIIRYTEEGDDWVHLTEEGASRAGVSAHAPTEQPRVLPHPPKSST